MTIIDRRASKKKSVTNRNRFIKRYKNHIKRKVADIAAKKGITDVLKDREVTVSKDDMSEPTFQHDSARGKSDYVLTGNETLSKGDKIKQPPEDNGRGAQGSNSGEGFDEFTFTLTKEEFLDLYFSDMELPDFVKERIKGSTKEKWKRHGYSKDGIPARLDLLKTLKQAMARRIATKSDQYLDNLDLRYKLYTKQPYPIRHAVMFCIMDVSYSMGEIEKDLAKRFFLLLYLFLHKNYETVDIRFIRHTHSADEVDEHTFFHGLETGGTVVSEGLRLANEIIDKEYKLDETNVYISQASDGDNWPSDVGDTAREAEKLLAKVQYFVYIQVDPHGRYEDYLSDSLIGTYEPLLKSNKHFKTEWVEGPEDIYPTLRELFKRGEQ